MNLNASRYQMPGLLYESHYQVSRIICESQSQVEVIRLVNRNRVNAQYCYVSVTSRFGTEAERIGYES